MSSIQKILSVEDSVDREINQYRESLNTSYEKQKLAIKESIHNEINEFEKDYRKNLQEEIENIDKEAQKIINNAQSKANSIHFQIDSENILSILKEEIEK